MPAGRYVDRLERRDGEWRIASRRAERPLPLAGKADDIATAVAKTGEELGPVEILVNNAALSPFCKVRKDG